MLKIRNIQQIANKGELVMSKKTKCYSVRLSKVVQISPLAYKVEDFNGNSDIIPASQIFGQDLTVQKSDALWISAWILEKKCINYSDKKVKWL